MRKLLILIFLLFLFLFLSSASATAASFQGLGFLSGSISSKALSVSADGSVVVGSSGYESFRWTADSGMVGLGYLFSGGLCNSNAISVSADGLMV